jgi:hypothetical protein
MTEATAERAKAVERRLGHAIPRVVASLHAPPRNTDPASHVDVAMTAIPVRRLKSCRALRARCRAVRSRSTETCSASSPSIPIGDDGAAFLRAKGSANDHDLGLFAIGLRLLARARSRRPVPPRVGGGASRRPRWCPRGAVASGGARGQSDHGCNEKSLYAHDPDGNEFEVMWAVPRDRLHEVEGSPPVAPLDLPAVVAQFAG